MLPEYFEMIYGKYAEYFDNQYPQATDCIELDKQSGDIQKDIDDLQKRMLTSRSEVRNPYKAENCGFNGSSAMTKCINRNALGLSRDQTKGNGTRTASLKYLRDLLNRKQQAFITGDCRNQIETIRQDETAGMFSQNSESAEKRIISDSKNQQYAYLAIGAAVTLVALYLITKRK